MKSSSKFLMAFFFPLLLHLTACSKESPGPARDYHQLDTHAISNIGSASVTFNAEVTSSGKEPILDHGFAFAETRPFVEQRSSQVIKLGSKAGTGVFSANVEYPFERNTTYYVRPFVKTETTIVYGNMISFKAQL